MGVLILDMKFPKTCAACEWSRYSFPNAWCGRTHKTTDIEIAKNGRPDDCPLAHVQPHGRLIDADELKTAFPCGESVRTECVRATIDHAPTVLEAEEGET